MIVFTRGSFKKDLDKREVTRIRVTIIVGLRSRVDFYESSLVIPDN